ncbi:nicotinic acid mononucleotide adenyltransferase [Formosa agariphila KMM 3901]|uniref:Nicotinic acid mononucleotide adenyltransferase n=1 Tax=Formosa agariphila (strain DSM 15362 / KCTC 12365 / LMG 23005 / KMM 3901 / M-2Alg 35-1) TaxID=1347342 RepID=T2KPV1_FORAG|nr:hypothetical protein [Formosa agariphila]CDF80528.1 nicotinic acid mononucleotide adenyltransferase [Formosa agariphila KMM 3901]
MKNLIALLFSLFLINNFYAQIIESPEAFESKTSVAVNQSKDLAAITNLNTSKRSVTTTGVNATYINSAVFTDNATYVKVLQQRAAKYDVKNSENYNEKSKSSYNVVFNTKRGNMSVNYDDSGEIKSSQEQYKNVALPKAVIVNIMKAYPDWRFNTNICSVVYQKNKGHVTTYKVKISNGKQSKTVKSDDKGNII